MFSVLLASSIVFASDKSLPARPTPTLTLEPAGKSVHVSPNLWGIFFEEINHAGEGGLYAQLVQNPKFHVGPNGKVGGWQGAAGHVTVAGADGVLDLSKGESVRNSGFWGIDLTKEQTYWLDVEGRSSEPAKVKAIFAKDGSTKESQSATFGPRWQVKRIKIKAKSNVAGADLVLKALTGDVEIRYAALRPASTWKGHGLTMDLAQKVAAIHPSFVRFPGGCYVEGGDFVKNRFDWQTTVAPPQDRPGHLDDTWGYWSSDGLGFHEYLQWCEDMKAEPLFVFNCGMAHKETDSIDESKTLLREAMNAIEYADGPVTSYWGAVRARNGHPNPFHLKYVEIGNENGIWSGQKQYPSHFTYFSNAIKAKYPFIKTVANVRGPFKADYIDDHYYNSPGWFWQNDDLYARYSRSGPKVYVGEYAVTQDCGHGNLMAALAEAAFMTGLEKNGDVVKMASYAPLFVNVNDRLWNPDAIVFDGDRSYGTPSYWVQRLFATNPIVKTIATKLPQPTGSTATKGGVGISTWSTQVTVLRASLAVGGYTLDLPNSSAKPLSDQDQAVWTKNDDGSMSQTSVDSQGSLDVFSVPESSKLSDYDYNVKIRKDGGNEGFLIPFRVRDDHNFIWWNIGGWGNTICAVEKESNGSRFVISDRKPFKVETGRVYDISVKARGTDLKLYIDGVLVQEATDTAPPQLAADAGITKDGDLLLRVVNGTDEAQPMDLAGMKLGTRWSKVATATVLTGPSLTSENSFDDPRLIAPVDSRWIWSRGKEYRFAPRSVTILTFKMK